MISKNQILDIKKSISWYQEMYSEAPFLLFIKYFLISRNEIYFLISRNQILDIKKYLINSKNSGLNIFLDIKKWISWYQEINFISWYQELYFLISRNDFLISRNQIFDIKKNVINSKTAPQNTFLDIKKSISWYQEFDFLISRNVYYFLISRHRILDIKKCISWYQEMYFLISRNRILDIKKCRINRKIDL